MMNPREKFFFFHFVADTIMRSECKVAQSLISTCENIWPHITNESQFNAQITYVKKSISFLHFSPESLLLPGSGINDSPLCSEDAEHTSPSPLLSLLNFIAGGLCSSVMSTLIMLIMLTEDFEHHQRQCDIR